MDPKKTLQKKKKIKEILSYKNLKRKKVPITGLLILSFFILLLTISCKSSIFKKPSTTTPKEHTEEHSQENLEIFDDFSDLNIILVLAGLDAKGFANIGVIRGLEKNKIFPSRIVATGMGSLTSAFYAQDKNSFSLEWKHFKLSQKTYFDYSIFPGKTGDIKPDTLINFINDNIETKRIEELPLPITIVTTDIKSKKTYLVEKGSLAKAIYSSIAIPGIFVPIAYRNQVLFTGYLTEGLPVSIAIDKKPDAIIAVDLESTNKPFSIKTKNDIYVASLKTIGEKLISSHKENNNIFFISPDLSSVKNMGFNEKKIIINMGAHTVDLISDELKKYLSNIKRRKM